MKTPPGYVIAGAVIVLVVVVGGALLLIGLIQGDETDLERQPSRDSSSAAYPLGALPHLTAPR